MRTALLAAVLALAPAAALADSVSFDGTRSVAGVVYRNDDKVFHAAGSWVNRDGSKTREQKSAEGARAKTYSVTEIRCLKQTKQCAVVDVDVRLVSTPQGPAASTRNPLGFGFIGIDKWTAREIVGESDMLIPNSPPLIRIDRENREIVARQWVQTGDGPRDGYWQEQELVGIQAIATGGDRVVPLQWK